MNGREMARAAGISERQLYNWVKKKWLQPQRHDVGYWTGEELWFNDAEQDVVRRMVSLVKAGLYPAAAAKVVRGHKGALSKLLAAVQPCLTDGEMTYRLTTAAGSGQSSGEGRGQCAVPPLPGCVYAAAEGSSGSLA